jgi:type IV secretion system protein VirB6/type IV secretion system protein TrbL
MSEGINLKEMGVMLIVCVILVVLVNRIPSIIAGIITGASVGHSGIGNFGAGAALGAAGMAAAAAATGGAMLAAGAANAGGGAQALMAAFSKASDNVQSGSDVLTSMWGGGGGGGGGGGAKSEESTGSTASSGGAQASGGGSGARAEGQGGDTKGKDEGKSDQGQSKAGESKDGAWAGGAGKAEGWQQGSGGLMSTAGRAGLIAADAAANLAKGTAQVAKEKMASIKEAAMDRIAETTGGKIAAAIKAGSAKDDVGGGVDSVPTFGGNNLAGAGSSDADAAAEVAAFANRDTKSA